MTHADAQQRKHFKECEFPSPFTRVVISATDQRSQCQGNVLSYLYPEIPHVSTFLPQNALHAQLLQMELDPTSRARGPMAWLQPRGQMLGLPCPEASGKLNVRVFRVGKSVSESLPPGPGSAVLPGASWPVPPSLAHCPVSDLVEGTVLALPTDSGRA